VIAILEDEDYFNGTGKKSANNKNDMQETNP
jgi:hypothetical protein